MSISLTSLIHKNKQKLERERVRIEAELKELDESNEYQNKNTLLQESEYESRVEDMELKESNDSMKKTLHEYLKQVKTALNRINRSKYGICERCGKKISAERLDANPSATYCFSCAEIIEANNEAS